MQRDVTTSVVPDLIATEWTCPEPGFLFRRRIAVGEDRTPDEYSLEYLGQIVAPVPRSHFPALANPRWPYYIETPHGTLEVWRLRVRRDDTPVFIELLAHPQHGERILLRDIEKATRVTDATRALKGLTLLRKYVQEMGRPIDDGEVFRRDVETVWRKLRAQGDRMPTQEKVADELKKDRDHFRKLRREHFARPWHEVCLLFLAAAD